MSTTRITPTAHANVFKVLDLSTSHLPPRYAETGPGYDDGVSAYEHRDSGWMMVVPDDPDGHAADYDEDDGPSPELLTIQNYARDLGCDYVLFDKDAEANPDLPTWDW